MNKQLSVNKILGRESWAKGNSALAVISLIVLMFLAVALGQAPSLVYVAFIGLSLVIGWFLNKYNNRPKTCLILTLLLVTYLTIFIGLRDFGVGTDTLGYIDYYWDTARYVDSLSDLNSFDYISKSFLLLSVFGHLFSDDHQTLLVLTSLVINLTTFLAVYIANYKKLEINWIIFIFFWQLMFMNTSMNEMRQDCAQGCALLGTVLFIKKKWVYAVIFFFIGFEFHTTMLVLLPMLACYLLDKYFSPKQRNIYTILSLVALVIIIASIFRYATWLISSGLISDHFDTYTDNSTFDSVNLFGVSYLSLTVLIVFTFSYLRKKRLISNSLNYILFTAYSISFILRLSAYSLVYLARLSHYYDYLIYFALAYLMTKFSKKIPLALQVMIYICIIYTWFNTCIIHTGNETYPYHSSILGI